MYGTYIQWSLLLPTILHTPHEPPDTVELSRKYILYTDASDRVS